MKSLDFLAESPNIFIFNEKSNKTKFGGFLFLIFIFVMIIISIIFILDYALNPKYEIEYLLIKNLTYNPLDEKYFEELQELYKDPYINPKIKFNIEFLDMKLNNASERYQILIREGGKNFTKIERNTWFYKKVSEMYFLIIYNCSDLNSSNCEITENDQTSGFNLMIQYDGCKIEHQDNNSPIQKEINTLNYGFTIEKTSLIDIQWEVIKYKEKKGLSRLYDKIIGKKNEYISGFTKSVNYYNLDDDSYIRNIYNLTTNEIKIISLVKIRNLFEYYTLYQRKHFTIFDPLIKILSVFPGIKVIFVLIIKYYSLKYDNYNLISKILKNNKNIKEILSEKSKNIMKKEMEEMFVDDDFSSVEEKMMEIKDDIKELKEIDNMKFDKNSNDNNKINNNEEDIPKFRFIYFLLNNIYCKCCGYSYIQEIIDKSNEILKKYYSVETIVKNQIMFENLLQDYKWNNSEYNSIDKNNLIYEFKNIIKKNK